MLQNRLPCTCSNLLFAIATYLGSNSQPTKFNPSDLQAIAVVPLPINGSKTFPLSCVLFQISFFTYSIGFWLSWYIPSSFFDTCIAEFIEKSFNPFYFPFLAKIVNSQFFM